MDGEFLTLLSCLIGIPICYLGLILVGVLTGDDVFRGKVCHGPLVPFVAVGIPVLVLRMQTILVLTMFQMCSVLKAPRMRRRIWHGVTILMLFAWFVVGIALVVVYKDCKETAVQTYWGSVAMTVFMFVWLVLEAPLLHVFERVWGPAAGVPDTDDCAEYLWDCRIWCSGLCVRKKPERVVTREPRLGAPELKPAPRKDKHAGEKASRGKGSQTSTAKKSSRKAGQKGTQKGSQKGTQKASAKTSPKVLKTSPKVSARTAGSVRKGSRPRGDTDAAAGVELGSDWIDSGSLSSSSWSASDSGVSSRRNSGDYSQSIKALSADEIEDMRRSGSKKKAAAAESGSKGTGASVRASPKIGTAGSRRSSPRPLPAPPPPPAVAKTGEATAYSTAASSYA